MEKVADRIIKVMLKRTKRENMGFGVTEGSNEMFAFYEYLFTDTGSPKKYNFAVRMTYRNKNEVKDTLPIEINFLEESIHGVQRKSDTTG